MEILLGDFNAKVGR